jgi:hypothetical protein
LPGWSDSLPGRELVRGTWKVPFTHKNRYNGNMFGKKTSHINQGHWTVVAVGIAGLVLGYTSVLVHNGIALGAPVKCHANASSPSHM